MTKNEIRTTMISTGVQNCLQFGYPNVNSENILTDLVYRKTFLVMLRDDTNINVHPDIETVRLQLIQEISALGE